MNEILTKDEYTLLASTADYTIKVGDFSCFTILFLGQREKFSVNPAICARKEGDDLFGL